MGVFPEGERSWDGRLQPLRSGTIRLLLKAGVPVIPCGMVGIYEVFPRWGHMNWFKVGLWTGAGDHPLRGAHTLRETR